MILLKRIRVEFNEYNYPLDPAFWIQYDDEGNLYRALNQIIIDEESDITPVEGVYKSHFNLYLDAMVEIGAPLTIIDDILSYNYQIESPKNIYSTFELSENYCEKCKEYDDEVLDIVQDPDVIPTLVYFVYGREAIIPGMFKKILDVVKDVPGTESLQFYLKRHIEVDADSHSNLAKYILDKFVERTEYTAGNIEQLKNEAIAHRIKLWDAIADEINNM